MRQAGRWYERFTFSSRFASARMQFTNTQLAGDGGLGRQTRRRCASTMWSVGILLFAGCFSLSLTAYGEERSTAEIAALRDFIAEKAPQSHEPAEEGRGAAQIAVLRDIIAETQQSQHSADEELPFEELPAPGDATADSQSSTDDSIVAREDAALPLRRPPTGVDEVLQPDIGLEAPPWEGEPVISTPWQVPSGFSGPSGVAPVEHQQDSHFVPVPDRWRIGFPAWDRYGPDHSVLEPQDPFEEDAPYVRGWLRNPYRQNVIKGDYPIIGQHTFLNVTATSFSNIEFRQVPTPTTPFESTPDPGQEDFFGDPDQFFLSHDLKLSFEMFHGDAGFKPFDWQARITPVFNINYLDVEELGVVSPDVRRGTHRFRNYETIEEWFVETKLLDTSPYYDFTSLRVGSQPFVSDFRGFIFADINRGARLFGTRNANRDQFNLIALRPAREGNQ